MPEAPNQRPTLGSLLRNLRTRRGWTLKEMSHRSGIPTSTLSKVENDQLTLTYDKLQSMCERLNLRMSEFFADSNEVQAINARRSIGTRENAIRVSTGNYEYYFLCPELRKKRMVPVLTEIRARSLADFGPLVRHAGEEFIYVVEGRVVIHTEFYDPLELGPGQSIYIDSQMGHAFVAAEGSERVVVLGVCSSADEGLLTSLLALHGGARIAATPGEIRSNVQYVSGSREQREPAMEGSARRLLS